MEDKKKTPLQNVSLKKMQKQGIDVLAAFGGLALGKAASKALDKLITSKSVSGLMGVEMSAKTAKYIKPVIITGVGLATAQIGSSKRQKPLVYAGLGFASVGVNDIFVVITGKDALSGIDGIFDDDFVAVNGLNGEYVIEEPTPMDLPELGNAATGFDYVPQPFAGDVEEEIEQEIDQPQPVMVNGFYEEDSDISGIEEAEVIL